MVSNSVVKTMGILPSSDKAGAGEPRAAAVMMEPVVSRKFLRESLFSAKTFVSVLAGELWLGMKADDEPSNSNKIEHRFIMVKIDLDTDSTVSFIFRLEHVRVEGQELFDVW